MEEKQKNPTPIQILATAMAEMTVRAVEAERALDAEKKNSSYWCTMHCKSENRASALQQDLDRETAAHENTKQKLRDLLERMQEGAGRDA